jgi:hypothetical protein
MQNSLTKKELHSLRRYSTPKKIQEFLDDIPFNYELQGETCMSPRRVLREKKAHCLEGAMFAALCLMLKGYQPRIMSFKVAKGDIDHTVTVFKENGYYGAISKTNHAVLRYRDPVYKTLRELAMSYFHEYFINATGKKTMLGYSPLVNLMRFGKNWMTSEEDLWNIAEYIYDMPHNPITKNKVLYKHASIVERKAADILEWSTDETKRLS